jgi:hypothetical protein
LGFKDRVSVKKTVISSAAPGLIREWRKSRWLDPGQLVRSGSSPVVFSHFSFFFKKKDRTSKRTI